MSLKRMPSWASAIVLFICLVLLWEGSVHTFDISVFVLPPPSKILSALIANWPLLASSALVTLKITLGAFFMAFISGAGLALAFSASRTFANAAFPLVIALQVTPVVAIAPIIIIWVGIDKPQLAMLILATVVAFFPILANTMLGLRATDPALRELFRLYGASASQRFLRLELPSALPYLLAGLKISGGLALVGAIVAEFVAGSGASQGLAFRIIEAGNRLQIPAMFAALFLLTAMGLLVYGALSLAERKLLAWHESQLH